MNTRTGNWEIARTETESLAKLLSYPSNRTFFGLVRDSVGFLTVFSSQAGCQTQKATADADEHENEN